MLSNESVAVFMSMAYFFTFSSLVSLRIISSIPITAFIGVLISWDIFVRNCDLLFVAVLASSHLAVTTLSKSSRLSSCCILLFALNSRKVVKLIPSTQISKKIIKNIISSHLSSTFDIYGNPNTLVNTRKKISSLT